MRHSPDAILNATVALIDRDGVHISTARIATHAGVSNGTLFNYFPTKQQLIDAAYLMIKRDLATRLGPIAEQGAPRATFEHVWRTWIRWATDAPAHHRVGRMLYGAGIPSSTALAEGAALLAPVGTLFERGVREGVLVDLPLPFLTGLAQHHVDVVLAADLPDTLHAMAFDTLWRALTPP